MIIRLFLLLTFISKGKEFHFVCCSIGEIISSKLLKDIL